MTGLITTHELNAQNNIISHADNHFLFESYPNPFNVSTTISYQLPYESFVNLSIYDITGREIACIAQGYMSPGMYNIEFNANHLTSGVYFARFEAGETREVRKLLLIK